MSESQFVIFATGGGAAGFALVVPHAQLLRCGPGDSGSSGMGNWGSGLQFCELFADLAAGVFNRTFRTRQQQRDFAVRELWVIFSEL